MTCQQCGGVLPLKPYIWTCWSDEAHIWRDHEFCSRVCRDTWLRNRQVGAVCYRCQQRVYPDELVFRWVAEMRRSEPHHMECAK